MNALEKCTAELIKIVHILHQPQVTEIVLNFFLDLPHSYHVTFNVIARRYQTERNGKNCQQLVQRTFIDALLVIYLISQLTSDLETVVKLTQPMQQGIPQHKNSSNNAKQSICFGCGYEVLNLIVGWLDLYLIVCAALNVPREGIRRVLIAGYSLVDCFRFFPHEPILGVV